MVINCIEIANKIESKLIDAIAKIKSKYNIIPKLVIIKISDDLASDTYIKHKVNKANLLNIKTDVILLNKDTSNDQLLDLIDKLNNDNNVHGIILQLPTYNHINNNQIFEKISPSKDVDGLTIINNGKLWSFNEKTNIIPCTVKGIMQVFENVNYSLSGKHIVIINRSNIVGKPLISQLLNANATVTICHRETNDLIKHTLNADVIISAVGKKDFINKDMVKKGCFIIDVGICVVNNKIYGDCNFEQLEKHVSYITPVPNGIGKLTVINIYYNLIKLIALNNNIEIHL